MRLCVLEAAPIRPPCIPVLRAVWDCRSSPYFLQRSTAIHHERKPKQHVAWATGFLQALVTPHRPRSNLKFRYSTTKQPRVQRVSTQDKCTHTRHYGSLPTQPQVKAQKLAERRALYCRRIELIPICPRSLTIMSPDRPKFPYGPRAV